MAPRSAPPGISVEPEQCPAAVIEWYNISGSEDRKESARRKDLAWKAKKHLRALGWRFWYVDKKGRWELRYTSPTNGKNYISLRKACESCIEEGGCGPQNVHLIHQTRGSDLVKVEHASTRAIPSPSEAKKRPRKPNKTSSDEECSRSPSSKREKHVGQSEFESEATRNSGRRTLASWLIDNQVLASGTRLFCRGGKNNVVKKGRLLRGGIACDCCDLVFTLTGFEAHAGCTRHRPSTSIFLEEGRRSLMECQREALGKAQGESYQEQNDCVCSVCHYGGDLILCDRCPSSFHLSCLGLDQVPDGDWFCPACRCKICDQRRCREECADYRGDNTILVCVQCEQRCHLGCSKIAGFTNLEHHPSKNWFCSVVCGKVFFSLQKLVGKQIPVGADNLTWTLLKTVSSSDNGGDLTSDSLGAFTQNESKLSVALGVLHECFNPVIDALSGRDMIRDVVFSRGSEHNRLNFRGFYTAILEKNGEVISVATVRIYGQMVAELPFVATKGNFRRQGMCRILMNELEKLLTRLGVGTMVLHSSHNAVDTWTNSFRFARMTALDKSQFLDYTFLEFQDTILCHKPLIKTFNELYGLNLE